MRPKLEDVNIGPAKTPAESFRWEPSPRHVRTLFNGQTVADSRRVMLLIEPQHLPVFYFPFEDVRSDWMEPTDLHTFSPLKGDASYWSIRVGDRIAENAAWSYPNPPVGGPAVAGYVAFYWNKLDTWYEEDEPSSSQYASAPSSNVSSSSVMMSESGKRIVSRARGL